MRFSTPLWRWSIRLAAASMCVLNAFNAFAQQPQPSPPHKDDVVTVSTALVQTDVMVFDGKGSFIDQLSRDQFVLKIDGKPREILGFQRVVAGNRNEDAQLAAARGNSAPSGAGAPVPLDRGRVLFFFVDDVHLSPSGMDLTRKSLLRFVEREMSQNDQVAITSASGQIGFLQQLTDNKTVLVKAINRLNAKNFSARDVERPPMSEFQADLVESNDRDVVQYFVDFLVRDGIPAPAAEQMVHARASQIVQQSAHFTRASLSTLHNLIRTSTDLGGRKILFLLSEGFFMKSESSEMNQRLRELTSDAGRAGVVIYSIDARGLVSTTDDAGTPGDFDPSGRTQRSPSAEIIASQNPLNAIARDTGGRLFINNNDLSKAVNAGLKETSIYYLLAWRPETEQQKNPKFRRIEVSIVGKPELVVRFRSGFGEPSTVARDKSKPENKSSKPADLINRTLRSTYPITALPVALTLNFVNLAERGSTLATSIKIDLDPGMLTEKTGGPSADIDLAAAVFDEQGVVVHSFDKRFSVKPVAGDAKPLENVSYNDYAAVKPGLYQVRVAALDAKNRAGSAMQWIEVPDIDAKTLTMSSLLIAESRADSSSAANGDNSGGLGTGGLSIDHRFPRSSHISFLLFVYNATSPAPGNPKFTPAQPGATATSPPGSTVAIAGGAQSQPDLKIQWQVFRDDQPVTTEPVRQIPTIGISDLTRIPYAADLPLDKLQPGRYLLRVTVLDLIAKTSASRQFSFSID
jgi:VWFA-related protein